MGTIDRVEPVIHPGTLYSYSAGVYCGVFMTERVMRKMVALQAAHLEAVKRLLSDSKDELHPYHWTLHYPDGEQTHVHFIATDDYCSVERAITNATTSCQPKACFPVFIASGMDEAKDMADARYQATAVAPAAQVTP